MVDLLTFKKRCYHSGCLLSGQEHGNASRKSPTARVIGVTINQVSPLQNPPLYLHITSTTKEGLEQAVAKIEELMKQELPQLVDERRFRRRDQEQPVERDEFGRV